MSLIALFISLITLGVLIKKKLIFSIAGFLNIFNFFYVVLPFMILTNFAIVIIQSLKIENFYDEHMSVLILYQTIVFSLSAFFINKNITVKLEISKVANQIMFFLLKFFFIIVFLSFLKLIFLLDLSKLGDRIYLFNLYESNIQSAIVVFAKNMLIAFVSFYAYYKRNLSLFYLTLPIVFSDLIIMGRSFILPVMMSFLYVTLMLNKKIDYKKIFFIIIIVYLSRLIMTGFQNEVLNANDGNFEIAGEFLNVFSGAVFAHDLGIVYSLGDFFQSVLGYLKPPFVGSILFPEWPQPETIALKINNELDASIGIFGLAGSLLSEELVYSDIWFFFPWMIIAFIKGSQILLSSKTISALVFYFVVIFQIPMIFRWSGITYVFGNINMLLYFFLPIILIELYIRKKEKQITKLNTTKNDSFTKRSIDDE